MRRAGLRNVEVVKAVDVDGRGGVESVDVAIIETAVDAESGNGAVNGVGHEVVASGVDRDGRRGKQTRPPWDDGDRCTATSLKEEEVTSAWGRARIKNVCVACRIYRYGRRRVEAFDNGVDCPRGENAQCSSCSGLKSLGNRVSGD